VCDPRDATAVVPLHNVRLSQVFARESQGLSMFVCARPRLSFVARTVEGATRFSWGSFTLMDKTSPSFRQQEKREFAMPTREDSWPEGTPNWVDLTAPDIESAKGFYGSLFGWEFVSGGEESGGYLLAHKDGASVAGLGPSQDGQMPTSWTTYFASTDIAASAGRISSAGGEVLLPPMDVMDSGRMVMASDSHGVTFGVWQAGKHIGIERYNEHGALCWNDLHTPEYEGSRAFYADVFDFSFQDFGGGEFTYSAYSVFQRKSDRADVGGIHLDMDLPSGAPGRWLSWFACDDVDAVTASAQNLGATVVMPLMDSPFGRMSVVKGLQSEVFGLIQLPIDAN
jgi:predicted enzyme related to lactoylglutathione lyase